ncbi:MAG: acetate--CoA ligase family protein [archaeon]
MSDVPDIKDLFEPKSIAIVGASGNPDKIGYKILENVVVSGFNGKIFPVNPKGGDILGLKTYVTIEEINEEIDIACIVIPSQLVYDSVLSCAKKKVKFLVIITSGFSEVGNHELEAKIVAVAKENNMRILGPNIFGIYSSRGHINATFGQKDILPGSVAIITQSGALGIAMMGKTKTANMGLSAMVSIGNKSDIDETDLLEYLMHCEDTKVIMMYIEGIKRGNRLAGILKQVTRKKPVIVIKAGKSKRGALAAASHTGSLAGADEVFSDIMRQCGAIRAESVEEAFDWCNFFANSKIPNGENTVIITNGGGIGVMAADACEKFNVSLMDDIDTMKRIFSNAVPSFGSLKNPIDITGQATISDYEKALDAANNEDKISSVICLGCETAVLDADKLPIIIENIMQKAKKPFVFSFIGGVKFDECIVQLKKKNIPITNDVYEAASCFGAMSANYRNIHKRTDNYSDIKAIDKQMDFEKIERIVSKVKSENRNFLLANEASQVMEAGKISMPKSKIAKNTEEAVEYAGSIGYPVVMKIVSKDIIHKSDAGGVIVGVKNSDEVYSAYGKIIDNCKNYKADAVISGIEIAEMLRPGVESIVGARKDKALGPVVMFGLGGVYVEIMKDVSFRSFPFDRQEALELVKETKTHMLLEGARGEKKKDIDVVTDMILKLGLIVEKVAVISDIEINPLRVYDEGEGAKAIDVRILLNGA